MGTNLNSDGGLTESQKNHADKAGIPRAKYREILLQRIIEVKGGEAPVPDYENTRKVKKVKADNPVLVVGHGPSFFKKMDQIKKWKHTLVATDICLRDLLKHDIIPDYVLTSEASKQTCYMIGFDMNIILKHGIKIRHSSITRNDVIDAANVTRCDICRFAFEEEVRCSNVGLFACNFAVHELKADKLVLVGFEHSGNEYDDYVYRVWNTDFWYFVKKWPKQIVINCSEGGNLYFRDHTLESTLDELEFVPKE
jgi:hypothetical protein